MDKVEQIKEKLPENLTLEEAFGRLDALVEALEDREISLEDSFRTYQEGMELLKLCNDKIDQVEKKILVMNGDGGLDEF
jgi:exodeoxyribonuclease VII small subunit